MATKNKLPELLLAFWVMKICATTLGETGGDLFSQTLNIGYTYTSIILLAVFGISLAMQMASTRYEPLKYWFVILATSTAGTTMSDFLDRTLGLGYATGAALLASLLVGILVVWQLTEKSLSVVDVHSRRAEAFYWSAILVSNTLGTALGDYLADDSGLGFAGGALLIGSGIGVVLILYKFTSISRVALFWVAFVLTRPFGATFGDLMTKPIEKGGLNLGTIGSSAVLLIILVVLVFREHHKHRQTA